MKTLFQNAVVLDGVNPPRRGLTVVVEDGRIQKIAEGSAPSTVGDTIIDLKGKTLMPGMTTGHWHPDYDNLQLTDLIGVPLGRTKPPAYLIAGAFKNLQNALQSGITRVIGAGCSNDIDASFQMAIADGKFDGPRILAAGRHLDTTGSPYDRAHWWYEMGRTTNGLRYEPADIFCDGPDEFRKAARTEIKRGVQVLKVFTSGGHGVDSPSGQRDLTPAELAAVVEVAHDRGVLVRSHCVGRQQIIDTVKAGVDIIDHGDEMDQECIDLMAKRGCFWVPSMLLSKVVLDAGGFAGVDMTPVQRDFDHLCEMMSVANNAGIRIVPGDDYGVSLTPHIPGIYSRELELYVKHVGMPALEVLRWATVNGAAMMRHADDRGVIEVGQPADLLVIDGDPLSDISLLTNPENNIPAIMVGGKFVKNALTSPARSNT